MKALVYEAPKRLTLREMPTPEPSGDTVLVRVEAVGVCGSDMHAFLGHDERRPAPLILGHEAAGVVASGPRNGERVTINPLVHCTQCWACRSGRENLCPQRQIISMPPREGAFAQYVVIPERNLVSVPDHVSLRAAALAEPMAVGWHAVRLALRTLHDQSARHVLIIGGGAIGVAAALALKAMGQDKITLLEPNDLRRDFLQKRCDLTAVAQSEGQYDLVVDAVGYARTRALASAQTHPGGVILHIGLADAREGLDTRRMTLQEITFIGTYTYTVQDFRDTASAIFAGKLGALDWIETRTLAAGAAAFDDLLAGRVASPKIVLEP